MKKLFICILSVLIIKGATAQQGNCNVSTTEKPWYVLNGQMVSTVFPNVAGSGISDYVLSIKLTSGLGAERVVQTEEMESISRLPIISGLSRWQVRFKKNRARTVYSVVVICGGNAFAYELLQPVVLCSNPMSTTSVGSASGSCN
jgi:hypothetical protein